MLYAIARTSILGAILPTAYLGGAASIRRRVGNRLFALSAAYFGVRGWLAPYFPEARLRGLVPLRS
jgi:hypothetical protein